jgi:hypothetical protein
VEAYLMDARVYRDGKPTSFRLELFVSDSLIGIGGRGYLGKGALKGVLTRDSLIMYFPTSREYVREARDSLLTSAACSLGLGLLDIERWLKALPEDRSAAPATVVTEMGNREAHCSLTWPECDWKLVLDYQLRDDAWRIKQIEFDDGGKTRFKAETRVHKRHATVDASRFEVIIPGDARSLGD